MTHSIRLPTFAVAMSIAFCLATLAPAASNQAVAQGNSAYGRSHAHYNGYGAGYNRVYSNGYSRYGYGSPGYGSAYSRYGYSSRRYTGYGSGSYGYGSSRSYVYPYSSGYGYSNGTSFRLNFGGLQIGGGTYRPIYTPNNVRIYSPYGSSGY